MQAVPTMLELVPRGVNKWVGLQALLLDLDLPREAVMAIGDGGNDLHIVANAGLGVAMGNAMPVVSAGLDFHHDDVITARQCDVRGCFKKESATQTALCVLVW